MNETLHNDVHQLILSLDDFQTQREHHLYFVKESFLMGEYQIHPKLIAANWLISCFNVNAEACVMD